MKIISMLLVVISLSACSSVTMRTDDKPKSHAAPTFQKTYTYWWWYSVGEHDVNVREICKGKPVEQIQTITTATDFLAHIFTLGIYAPRTARVWCKEGDL
ncbi:Bor family protein [Pseudomonas sp. HK3]